jgi:hypothetical protein
MRTVTRRGLFGGALAVVAAGIGGSLGWVTAPSKPVAQPPPPPRAPVLEAEWLRERELVERLDATIAAGPTLAAPLPVLRTDHADHADALAALLQAAGVPLPTGSSVSASSSASSAAGGTVDAVPAAFTTVAELSAAETAAARGAAQASLEQTGTAAATLASMAACEAGHLVLLG